MDESLGKNFHCIECGMLVVISLYCVYNVFVDIDNAQ